MHFTHSHTIERIYHTHFPHSLTYILIHDQHVPDSDFRSFAHTQFIITHHTDLITLSTIQYIYLQLFLLTFEISQVFLHFYDNICRVCSNKHFSHLHRGNSNVCNSFLNLSKVSNSLIFLGPYNSIMCILDSSPGLSPLSSVPPRGIHLPLRVIFKIKLRHPFENVVFRPSFDPNFYCIQLC